MQLQSAPLPRYIRPLKNSIRRVSWIILVFPLLPPGKFLWLSGNNTGHLYSRVIPRAQSTCKLEVALYQIDMANGNISLIVEPYNILGRKQENRSYVAKDNHGNNRATWVWILLYYRLGFLFDEKSMDLEEKKRRFLRSLAEIRNVRKRGKIWKNMYYCEKVEKSVHLYHIWNIIITFYHISPDWC